jgi:hypothetical protein
VRFGAGRRDCEALLVEIHGDDFDVRSVQ